MAESQRYSQQAMATLRLKALHVSPAEIGIQIPENKNCFGVLVEWPMGDLIATILALADGTASLYTNSTFGIVGGFDHAHARNAAKDLIQSTEDILNDTNSTTDFAYPKIDQVKFFLLTKSGVRSAVVNFETVENSSAKPNFIDVFAKAQNLLAELRKITDSKVEASKESPKREWSGASGYTNCLLTAMSEGAIKTVQFSKSDQVPSLSILTEASPSLKDWIDEQSFDYKAIAASEVIATIKNLAVLSRLPFLKRSGFIKTVHVEEDGSKMPRIFDIELGSFARSVRVSLAEDSDPRIVKLLEELKEAESKK